MLRVKKVHVYNFMLQFISGTKSYLRPLSSAVVSNQVSYAPLQSQQSSNTLALVSLITTLKIMKFVLKLSINLNETKA
jgi:hypothetical protein